MQRILALAFAALWMPAAPATALDVDASLAALETLRAGYARDPGPLPTSFEVRLTAWQTSKRGFVLSGDRTPGEEDPYVMTHPLYLFRWGDGTTAIADAGLAPDGARSFGRPTEFLGAEKTVCGVAPFAGIDPARVRAAVFSHLHVDHIQGLRAVCANGSAIEIRISPEQADSDERFEVGGRGELEAMAEAGCVRSKAFDLVDADSVAPGLAGLPGLHRVATPGHTPGSQLIIGFVRGDAGTLRSVVVAGDVVNHRAGFRHDRPKPWWYRRLIVREVDDLQAENRHLLARLDAAGFEILVDHHTEIPEGTKSVPCP